ncbi:MAG: DUF6114 domain-containing protein [Thaumarchaeota archaeon]|nr:DUF6114 domain-containing protein [Nitrososphaerota archaeon]
MEKITTQQTTSAYPKTGSILALLGGIVITLSGVLLVLASAFILPSMNFPNLTVPPGMNASSIPALVSGIVGIMGVFGIISGAIVLVSAVMLLAKVGQRRTWGVVILVFSILSFIGLGGFIVGAVLGMVGSILTLRWKAPAQ